ncbi:hypothetical protein HMPREF0514_10291 [Lactobacillus paragasseri JV-V03]|uniref:Uncharacterized protein n=1 Tax=Lactobacillus paragasseri JV-V03 TaxID=525326 RepID=A0AA86ZS72_9LACO|nr:hypothetical protein [Lactobacillus paragasseri]EFJ69847.1 hypothetical protein HMPREF0514_10291 [Lactobacillus paragasseri JV-V03]
MKVQQITSHGQDEMIFHCNGCGNDVAIDTFDLLIAEDNLHCPVCGTRNDQLDLLEDR